MKARTEHLRGIKTALLTPTRYNEEITIFVLWSGRFCPCTCKILLVIAKAWLRCLPFLYNSGNVHVKYTFCLRFCCNIFQLRPGEIINGKYCECSNLDCPSDPDTDLICGGKVHSNFSAQTREILKKTDKQTREDKEISHIALIPEILGHFRVASVSKRVHVQNLLYENEFDMYENENENVEGNISI